jgi:uncharacterized linocin/CFP29 family protein
VNHLYREIAPMSDRAWEEVEDAARRAIRNFIAGRRLFPLLGPHGYDVEAVPTGEVGPAQEADGVSTAVLQPRPMVELRTGFSVSRREIEVLDRGGDTDLDQVVEAARRIAGAEDRLVFDGLESAGIKGVVASSPHDAIPIGGDFRAFPDAVAKAIDALRAAGVEGPYGIALGPREHEAVLATTDSGGYPILKHIHAIVDGPLVWSPTLDGSVVVSMRGGDFEIHSGLDFSIRYLAHDREHVEFELLETVTFRNLGTDAAACIR